MSIKDLINKVGHTYRDGSSTRPGVLYGPIPFEEYFETPVEKINCIEELQTILKNYDFKDKKVLEVGAAGGFTTFNLASIVQHIAAFEADPHVLEVLKAVQKEKNIKNITFKGKYDESVTDYDCCIMMNVHQWIVKQNGFKATKQIMKNIAKTGCTLFFQTAHKESSAMYKVDELKTLDDIIEYLFECGFKPQLLHKSVHSGLPRYLFKG